MGLIEAFAEDFVIIDRNGEKVADIKAAFQLNNPTHGTCDCIISNAAFDLTGYAVKRKADGSFYQVEKKSSVSPNGRLSAYTARRIYMADKEQAEKLRNADKEICCTCGKLLARRTKSGKIMVWCKKCHKEVELEVEPYEPVERNK